VSQLACDLLVKGGEVMDDVRAVLLHRTRAAERHRARQSEIVFGRAAANLEIDPLEDPGRCLVVGLPLGIGHS
jgi:hypothetical protein